MNEICTLLVKIYIICSRMERVNLHARPSIIQVGCPIYCYQLCALDHAKGVMQTWITAQSLAILMSSVNIGKCYGLLPDSTKPLPKAMLSTHHIHVTGNDIQDICEADWMILQEWLCCDQLSLSVSKTHYKVFIPRNKIHGVRAFWILEVQFGSCGYIGILLVSK